MLCHFQLTGRHSELCKNLGGGRIRTQPLICIDGDLILHRDCLLKFLVNSVHNEMFFFKKSSVLISRGVDRT